MVFRTYVEKKPGFDVEAQQLAQELRTILGIGGLTGLRVINRYDVEGVDEALFQRCVPIVFSEPQVDTATAELPVEGVELDERGFVASAPAGTAVFAVEYLPGQFDQRADSASECVQLVSAGERPDVRSAKVYVLSGELSAADVDAIKHYVINPVEAREATLSTKATLKMEVATPADVEVLDAFLNLDEAGLAAFIANRGLAMDLADIKFCQEYFASEKRNPTITEIRVIDTYWSDHCRHTTFGTQLENVQIDDEVVKAAFDKYLEVRHELGRDAKPVCLMDMGTIGAKWLKKQGILKNLDESEEINACTVKVKVDVDGEDQDWLFLFKNETHNHPTEIEPFGGAATCIGGAIRDPLSGRSYVYQAMRVTGAADPTVPVSTTRAGKLPQRKLVTTAAAGYSSYGNQIGLATGQVSELYHPGYMAKRMEVGAVVGATPASHVRRECPAPGDKIVLLGGRTGRDGIGGATGSSKTQNVESLEECGAEVQKGNAPVERKLQRLFRRGDACRLIKRCNDFGAGGVSVAVGELADGLDIDLDRVTKKYEGLDGTELAISESQERMAVALAASDVDEFMGYAREENLEATVIATVTEDPRVHITWRGNTIVDLSREFLASNGAPKHMDVHVLKAERWEPEWAGETLAERMTSLVRDLNVASNKGLSERFDSTIGAATVLMPFGGKTSSPPTFPRWSRRIPRRQRDHHGQRHGVGLLRAPAHQARRWGDHGAVSAPSPARWTLALKTIGGKDSMSGSFEDAEGELNVPPTLISFAVAVGKAARATSPEFKGAGHRVICVEPAEYGDDYRPNATDLLETFDVIEKLVGDGAALAISTPGYGGEAEALFKMCVGNQLGVALVEDVPADSLFDPAYGSFLVELADDAELPASTDNVSVELLGTTTETYEFVAAGETCDLTTLQEAWESGIEGVFPYRTKVETEKVDAIDYQAKDVHVFSGAKLGRPRVTIPVFPGNNCEYDSARLHRRPVPRRRRLRHQQPHARRCCREHPRARRAHPQEPDRHDPGRLLRRRRARWLCQVHHGLLPRPRGHGRRARPAPSPRWPHAGHLQRLPGAHQARPRAVRRHRRRHARGAHADVQHHRPPPEPPRAHPRREQPLAVARPVRAGQRLHRRHLPRRGPLRRQRRGSRPAHRQWPGRHAVRQRSRRPEHGPRREPQRLHRLHRGHHQPRRPRLRQNGPRRAPRRRPVRQRARQQVHARLRERRRLL